MSSTASGAARFASTLCPVLNNVIRLLVSELTGTSGRLGESLTDSRVKPDIKAGAAIFCANKLTNHN